MLPIQDAYVGSRAFLSARAHRGQVKGRLRRGEKKESLGLARGKEQKSERARRRVKTNKLTSESLVYCWVGTR